MTLDELEQLRAAIPDDDQAPLGWPPMSLANQRTKIADLQQRRRSLDYRLSTARIAQRTIDEGESFVPWHAHLHEWRAVLCSELLALPPRIRDTHLLAVQRSLDLSIQVIDFGIDLLDGTGLALVDLRVGELIAAAGYEPGTWQGSLPEVELIAARREAARSTLEEALLDDDERERREAEAKALRDAYNGMRVKIGADGRSLVARRDDGSELPVGEMTPLQRRAFEVAAPLTTPRAAPAREWPAAKPVKTA